MTSSRSSRVASKVTEVQLVSELRHFLVSNCLIRTRDSYFNGDSDEYADVELAVDKMRWPSGVPDYLILEAKSHHSKDSPNTINKIFGQLLKEANKSPAHGRRSSEFCLGILIPTDSAVWYDSNGKTVTRGSGVKYYRDGFRRIKQDTYNAFGKLVDARYVLAYSVRERQLAIYDWSGFYSEKEPLSVL